MLFIHKITEHETVDYAASELKKYLRMMMPDVRDIRIDGDKNAKGGFRLGLMEDFSLDTSDATDKVLDDLIYIDTDEEGGVIAGDNARSVLLAVYEYLRQNGCRWLFPGPDGEYIPLKRVKPVKYRHLASLRFRGPCIEGSLNQATLLETVDFIPKAGMNLFQMQFFLPAVFYRRRAGREYKNKDAFFASEWATDTAVLQWKTECEAELSKRSIQIHDVGHAWTTAPFGIDTANAWAPIPDEKIPEDALVHLALLDGKRQLRRNSPLFSQFCMSSPAARKIVASYVADYAKNHPYVDFLHVWLGDGMNNYCECENCVKDTVSDQYVVLLNEIDRELSARELKTRIVFIVYQETTWAPLKEYIKNQDRFTLLIAPYFRSYTKTMTGEPREKIVPFERNKIGPVTDLDTYIEYLDEWKKSGWQGSVAAFEYHFWRHQHFEPSGIELSRRIFEDAEGYHARGVNGMIACGTQRSYFPHGFGYFVFARKQFDLSYTFEELKEDYFFTAYGEDWQEFYNYFEKVYEVFGFGFMEAEESVDYFVSPYYNPERAEKLAAVREVTAIGRALAEKHKYSIDRVKTLSIRLLRVYNDYLELLADALRAKALDKDDEAKALFEKVTSYLSDAEAYFERYFDLWQICFRIGYLLSERGTGVKPLN